VPAAMRAGVRDVVDLSKGAEDLRDSLGRALDWSSKIKMARETDGVASPETRGTIISVFSSKGGTGKTFLTSNLGAAIAVQTQQDTAVVDLDFDLVCRLLLEKKKNKIEIRIRRNLIMVTHTVC